MSSTLDQLRAHMKDIGIDYFYVPRADEFQNEYVPPSNNRLEFITGFSGSAGAAIIGLEGAAFFTDGRYTIQAQDEVDGDIFDIYSTSPNQEPTPTLTPTVWLEQNVTKGQKIGLDPWIMPPADVARIDPIADKREAEVHYTGTNPIDVIWSDRPAAPSKLAVPHPIKYAGVNHQDKIKDMQKALRDNGAGSLILTFPEEIMWLFNIRGQDVEFNPLCLCYAILYSDPRRSIDAQLFIDPKKVDDALIKHLGDNIDIQNFTAFEAALAEQDRPWVDPRTSPMAVFSAFTLKGIDVVSKQSPIQMAKAQKNKTEMDGAVTAHIRDGVAVCRFLHRLSKADYVNAHTELSAANDLRALREEEDLFKDLSFDTISGAGPAGAIIHYRVTEDTDKPLTAGPLYLVDSGGQYLDGTTDITRTVAVTEPNAEMIDRFTRVLKGHIQVALNDFPKGTDGRDLDVKARAALKEVGLDFAHGTGHGVGSYLCVHEGPCGIHSRAETEFRPGMIVSNEPGFYQPGGYGIRIENLIMVEETGAASNDNAPLYRFRTLTLAPIDLNCVDAALLTTEEKDWLNTYHVEVYKTIAPLLEAKDVEAAEWLKTATQKI